MIGIEQGSYRRWSCQELKVIYFSRASDNSSLDSCSPSAAQETDDAMSESSKVSDQRINVGMSAIGLSLVTFFGIKKNIVVQTCCGHFPLCSTFSKNSTI